MLIFLSLLQERSWVILILACMLCQMHRGYPPTDPAQLKASFKNKVSNLCGCADILPNVNQYSVVFLSLQTDKKW